MWDKKEPGALVITKSMRTEGEVGPISPGEPRERPDWPLAHLLSDSASIFPDLSGSEQGGAEVV